MPSFVLLKQIQHLRGPGIMGYVHNVQGKHVTFID